MYSDALIGAKIKATFDDEHGLYGAKRIAASLNEDTAYAPVNHKKVARVMKSHGTSMALQNGVDASPPGANLVTVSCQI